MKLVRKSISLIMSIILVLSVFTYVESSSIENVQAANEQPAMWFMDDLNFTQIPGGDFSHRNTLNFDVTGINNDNIKAPFDCSIVKTFPTWESGNTVIIQSLRPVLYANGTVDYLSMAFAHDNDISDCPEGRVISQGEVFYQTGKYGNVTGKHTHVTCIAGKYTDHPGWIKVDNGSGKENYTFKNGIDPRECLFLSPNTRVYNNMNLQFRTYTGVIQPTNRKPIGYLDGVAGRDGEIYLAGWAFDPDEPTKNISIEVYVDGKFLTNFKTFAQRTDIPPSFPQYGLSNNHGFDLNISAGNYIGQHDITVFAIDSGGLMSNNVIIGTGTINISGKKHTLTLNPNGGTLPSGSQFTIQYGSTDYFEMSWNIPTRAGYKFDGWYTAASGGTKIYDSNGYCVNEGTYWSGNKCQTNNSYTLYAHWIPLDTTGPTISNIKVIYYLTDVQITCDVYDKDGVSFVEFPTWTLKADASGNTQDDLINPWERGDNEGNGKYRFYMSRSDHNNESGTYVTHIYAWDTLGNKTVQEVIYDLYPIESIRLSESNVTLNYGESKKLSMIINPSNTTNRTDITQWESSNPSVVKVDQNGNIQAVGIGTATITGTCKMSEYAAPQYCFSSTCQVTVKDTTAPVISNVQITNYSSTGYTVSCTVTDNVGIDRVQFPTWTTNKDASGNEQDDLIWHTGTVNGNTYSYNVKTSEHKNEKDAFYCTHIYAYDLAGNYTDVSVDCLFLGSLNLNIIDSTAIYDGTPKECTNYVVTNSAGTGLINNGQYFKAEYSNNVNVGQASLTIKGIGLYRYCSPVKKTFNIVRPSVESITLNKSTVEIKKGESATLTATVLPSTANQTVTWSSSDPTVATVNNGTITALKTGNTTITATSSNGLKATCIVTVLDNTPTVTPGRFSDVKQGTWYYDFVLSAVNKGLMSGYSGTDRFGPEDSVNRAQMVQVLYNMAGKPKVTSYVATSKFSDVYSGAWYEDAVNWAYNNNITVGMGNVFGADSALTREQMVTFFMNYSKMTGKSISQRTNITGYVDYSKVDEWARDNMSWGVSIGLISGSEINGTKYLDPLGNANRAQLATVLTKYCTYYKI